MALWLVGGIKLLRLSQVTIHHNHLLCARLIISIFIVIKIISNIIHGIVIITNLFDCFPASYFHAIFRHHILSKSKPKRRVMEQMFRATTRTISGLNTSIIVLFSSFKLPADALMYDLRCIFLTFLTSKYRFEKTKASISSS